VAYFLGHPVYATCCRALKKLMKESAIRTVNYQRFKTGLFYNSFPSWSARSFRTIFYDTFTMFIGFFICYFILVTLVKKVKVKAVIIS